MQFYFLIFFIWKIIFFSRRRNAIDIWFFIRYTLESFQKPTYLTRAMVNVTDNFIFTYNSC